MSDENSFKMILQNDDKKVYIDLSKGYDHVSNSLRKLGYYPYDVKFIHVRFKFTHPVSYTHLTLPTILRV